MLLALMGLQKLGVVNWESLFYPVCFSRVDSCNRIVWFLAIEMFYMYYVSRQKYNQQQISMLTLSFSL